MKQSPTRQKILDSARTLFAEKGFKGTTTSAIAQYAGTAEVTIYRYFKSKQEILIQCVQPAMLEIINRMKCYVTEADNLKDFVSDVLELRLRLYDEHYETFRIIFNEIPYSNEMLSRYAWFLKMQEGSIVTIMEKMEHLGQIKRHRNYLLFALGQSMSIWLWINYKKEDSSKGDKFRFSHEMLDVSEEHLIADLAELFLYGISGVPKEKL